MISFSPANTLDNGGQISEAVVTSLSFNPTTLRLSGIISAYFDSTHQASGKPMRTYQINSSITQAQSVGNLIALLESLAIAKYPDLQGGTQS